MIKARTLTNWLENPNQIKDDEAEVLQAFIQEYPYLIPAHFINSSLHWNHTNRNKAVLDHFYLYQSDKFTGLHYLETHNNTTPISFEYNKTSSRHLSSLPLGETTLSTTQIDEIPPLNYHITDEHLNVNIPTTEDDHFSHLVPIETVLNAPLNKEIPRNNSIKSNIIIVGEEDYENPPAIEAIKSIPQFDLPPFPNNPQEEANHFPINTIGRETVQRRNEIEEEDEEEVIDANTSNLILHNDEEEEDEEIKAEELELDKEEEIILADATPIIKETAPVQTEIAIENIAIKSQNTVIEPIKYNYTSSSNNFNFKKTIKESENELIYPSYTEDYFLHQGIAVSNEIPQEIEHQPIKNDPKSLLVMMSFTEWLNFFNAKNKVEIEEHKDKKSLKTMWQKEKLAVALEEENEEIPEAVFEMAFNSISKEDNLMSESFAKVLEKQGKWEQAIEMYKKLILQNPQKTHYFAEQIKKIQKNIQS